MASAERLRSRARALLRASEPLPRLPARSQAFDAVLAFALALAAIKSGDGGGDVAAPETLGPGGPPLEGLPDARVFLEIENNQSGSALVMLLIVVPLLFRRRYPLAALWVVMAAAPAVDDYHAVLRLSFYVCVIAAYSAAVYSPYRVPALLSLPLAAVLYSLLQESALPTVPDGSVPFLILVPIAVAADGLRRWRRRADEGRAQMFELQRRQVEALERATQQERARIARELHDVVTHNVSVMVIQAGAARTVLGSTPEAAREAMLAVEAGGRAAMAELRQVMGLLTMDSDGADAAEMSDLAPQPGLDRLAALVQRVRDTGLPVELATIGTPRPLASGVELAAYRVVQEALTNTVKHAGGASASVLVEYAADELRVDVTDTGGTPRAPAESSSKQGLVGLRERLAVYGGTLQSGPRISGGFRITAQIPLERG